MPPERRPPTVTESLPETDVPGHGEHPQRPVDPFREQLDSHSRDLLKPGQSGFFRPEAQSGRYSLRDMPVEEVVVRRNSAAPTEQKLTPVPGARGRSDSPARKTPLPREHAAREHVGGEPLARKQDPASAPADHLEVPPVLTSAARRWRTTGVFNVAPSASATHSRALERATLIALMQDSPLSTWPEAIVMRAHWLFRSGWEAGESDLDACLAILDLPSDAESEARLSAFLVRYLPSPLG